jgi:hypothetical protein
MGTFPLLHCQFNLPCLLDSDVHATLFALFVGLCTMSSQFLGQYINCRHFLEALSSVIPILIPNQLHSKIPL